MKVSIKLCIPVPEEFWARQEKHRKSKGYLSMVTLPKQRVREVHLRCRFCAHYHFNTQNKGIAFVPGKILSEGRTPSLPHAYRNIPHDERPQYEKNLSIVALLQLR